MKDRWTLSSSTIYESVIGRNNEWRRRSAILQRLYLEGEEEQVLAGRKISVGPVQWLEEEEEKFFDGRRRSI